MENPEYDYLFKVVLVGGTKWGKSSILKRLWFEEFSETLNSTVGVEFATKTVEIDDKKVKLQVWDTAGQERYKSIVS